MRVVAAMYAVRRVTHVRRYGEIVAVLVRYGFTDVVRALHLTSYLAAGRRALSMFGRDPRSDLSRAQRLRLTFEALGPTFIKFGQALSTHVDLLPADVIAELSRLQDSLPPLPRGIARRTVEDALGHPIDELFAWFEEEPLAAASIAQVHRAALHSGELVAMKVRRPGIHDAIESDLAILADLVTLAEHYVPDMALYSPRELLDEFARTIRRELDFVREGRLIDRVASEFADDPSVRYPAICWPLTTVSVLTMEFLDGVKVTAVGRGQLPGFDPQVVARRGADIVLKQILVHGLFHADPHPGNILILPGNIVALIDFGIVGRVDRRLREQLTDVIAAIGRRDAERLTEIVLEVATPLRPVNCAELTRDIEELLDLYAGVPLGQLSLAGVLRAVTSIMSRHRLKLPADVLLLIKAVSTIEGVGRQLDPSFTIVAHATPLVETLLAEKLTPAALTARTVHAGREVVNALRTLPADLAALAQSVRRDGLQIQFVHRDFDYFVREMDRSSNRVSFAIVIGAMVVGSSVMVHAALGPQAFGYPLVGVAGFVIAGLLGVGLALGVARSGRL